MALPLEWLLVEADGLLCELVGGAQVLFLNDHIQIKMKMPNPSQEPPASSKAPNEDLKDMDVLCTFIIRIESQNLDHGCIKEHPCRLSPHLGI